MSPELVELAETLGVTTEYLWAAMLRQARIDGLVNLVALLLFLAVAVVAEGRGRRLIAKMHYGDDRLGAWLIYSLCVVLAALVVVAGTHGAATGLLNPEGWALLKILEAVG